MKFIVTVILFLNVTLQARAYEQDFSHKAWIAIKPVFERIKAHPFNVQLEQGTLDQETFKLYKAQDAYYLHYFAKALTLLAAKVNNSRDTKLLLEFAQKTFDEDLQPGKDTQENLTMGNFAYTQFLIATAHQEDPEVLAAALLPCYWIYAELARGMVVAPKQPRLYQNWITLYSSERYQNDVNTMIKLTDRLAKNTSNKTRRKMLKVFETASQLEFHFWNDAFHSNLVFRH